MPSLVAFCFRHNNTNSNLSEAGLVGLDALGPFGAGAVHSEVALELEGAGDVRPLLLQADHVRQLQTTASAQSWLGRRWVRCRL